MNPMLFGKKFDLVDFQDVKLLMLQNDNLYRVSVPDNRKNKSLRDYSLEVARQGYPKSVVTPENVHQLNSARYGLFVYLNHLWEMNIELDVLDVGSHIGDFSVRMGSFIRTFNQKTKVISFDPTEAGALVDYNIQINGLQEIVQHEALAISDINGLIIFQVRHGYSDGSTAFSGSGSSNSNALMALFGRVKSLLKSKHKLPDLISYAMGKTHLIAKSVTLPDYLKEHSLKNNLFVKIDIEGLDSVVIDSLWPRINNHFVSIITEFTPSSFPSHDSAAKFLQNLGEKFIIYDIFYSPNPTRFDRLDQMKMNDFPRFIQEGRRYGYTDLLLIPQNIPKLDILIRRLDNLERTEDAYVL